MTREQLANIPWISDISRLVADEIAKHQSQADDRRPALQRQQLELKQSIDGWEMSLGNPELDSETRKALEARVAAARQQLRSIRQAVDDQEIRYQSVEQLIDHGKVVDRIDRLAEVMNSRVPTLANFELSQHIESIICDETGKVTVRLCKLGALTELQEFLVGQSGEIRETDEAIRDESGSTREKTKIAQRRRARLRVFANERRDDFENDTLREFVADSDRFGDLGDEWFDVIEYQVPKKVAWSVENATEVFERRRESKKTYRELAIEFGVSRPTISHAIEHFLQQHPERRQEIKVPKKRPAIIDVGAFCEEARTLWESGISKLQLAQQYGCSEPVINRALSLAYERTGQTMPTKEERKKAQASKARGLLDDGRQLEEVAAELGVSRSSARKLLRSSFEAEGQTMPDLRTREHRRSPQSVSVARFDKEQVDTAAAREQIAAPPNP